MHKGQIYALDFLVAVSIIILGFGILTSLAEMRGYDVKQKLGIDSIKQKAESAAIALVNSPELDCNIKDLHLAYSVDLNKLALIPQDTLKKKLGLTDYNALITVGSATPILNNTIGGENVSSIELNVAMCQNNPTFADLNACMVQAIPGNCSTKISLQKLIVKVTK